MPARALPLFLIWVSAQIACGEELSGEALYRSLLKAETEMRGIPFALADAVMSVESGYDPGARGDAGEVGLMQVLPSTALLMDAAATPERLAEPRINIQLGTRYLAEAWRLAKDDICTAVMKYRAGHGETRFSVKSVDYCRAVRRHMTAAGYKVTGVVPEAMFGFGGGEAPMKLKGRTRVRFGSAGGCFARVLASGRCLRRD